MALSGYKNHKIVIKATPLLSQQLQELPISSSELKQPTMSPLLKDESFPAFQNLCRKHQQTKMGNRLFQKKHVIKNRNFPSPG